MESTLSLAIKVTKQYPKYYFNEINTNRFTHKSFISGLSSFENSPQLSIATIGYSEEGREIKKITCGTGKTRVLLWSQMHGNESTATRAILDLLNFLVADDEFNTFRKKVLSELTLQFIPMLNPDGTERFQRRTSTEIDMNRDAVALQSAEGKILDKVVTDFKPHIGFNLHDQRRFYNVKETAIPSSISFLAPAYNQAREVNKSREKAMQLIAGMNQLLQTYIPNGVGLYDDTYSYRSFGDAIQAKGVSTILVESGWLANDMEKEAIRKLNFTALLGAFDMIASNSYTNFSKDDYIKIPDIDTKLFDVLIKNVKRGLNSNSKVDIGISRTEHLLKHPKYYSTGKVDDIGDLSAYYGFDELAINGLTAIAGKTTHINALENISMLSAKRLLKQGIIYIITEDTPFENHVPFPINIVHPRKLNRIQMLVFEGLANFLLIDKNKKLKYIVMNGFLVAPNKIDSTINGVVIS